MTVRTALYRHWDENENLLYVGISLSAVSRLAQHKNSSHWFDRITSMTVEWFDTRADALEAEREAIMTERPQFNKKHNAANDNERGLTPILVDGWTVYVVRHCDTKTFEGFLWARSLPELWDLVDGEFDPFGYEFAELSRPGGLVVAKGAGIKIEQDDDDSVNLEDVKDISWRRFTTTYSFDAELRRQDELNWTPFCPADGEHGLIGRIFATINDAA